MSSRSIGSIESRHDQAQRDPIVTILQPLINQLKKLRRPEKSIPLVDSLKPQTC